MKKRMVIIGAGFAGSCIAKMFKKHYDITVLEKDKIPGGMCKSYYMDGMVYEYGPHILANHHCSEEAVNFIKSNIEYTETSLTSASFVQGQFTYYPLHQKNADLLNLRTTVEQELENLPPYSREDNFETYLIDKVGKTFYEIYFKDFTEKFWGVDPKTISAEWAKLRHLGEFSDKGEMFFNKRWCAYPKKDWNELFANLLKDMKVFYNAHVAKIDFFKNKVILRSGTNISYDLLLSTLSIDELFGYCHGKLRYAGYVIEPKILKCSYYAKFNSKPISIVYFPEKKYSYTRITDYKTFQKKERLPFYQKRTIITIETPSNKHELYPFTDSTNGNLFDQYIKLASQQRDVVSFGRKGLYKYLTTDTTIEMALRLSKFLADWKRLNPEDRYKAYREIRGDWSN